MPLRDTNPPIGTLRWPVMIAQRGQGADPNSPGIVETFRDVLEVRADIQPIEAMTFYAGMQVDVRATHVVTIRFLDWLDTTHVVFRRTIRPDDTVRQEMFRIHRIREIEGRKRFVALEVEQEQRADG